MARGTYVLSGSNMTLSGAVTLAFLRPPTSRSIEIIRVTASQSSASASAMQRIQLVTQVTAFPTLVSQAPVATTDSDAASVIVGGTAGAAGTSGVNASAEGAGTKTVIIPDTFNILNGYLWLPSPQETIVLSASSANGFGVYLPAAPSSLSGWNCQIEFREW